MSKPLPLLETSASTFVKLSRKVTVRLGQQDENPLIADAQEKRVMSMRYQIDRLIERYQYSLFVEYFENMQDQVMLNFPGISLSLGDG
jgi:hypothetical protein